MKCEMRPQDPNEVRKRVEEGYARVAERAATEEPPHAAGVGRHGRQFDARSGDRDFHQSGRLAGGREHAGPLAG